MPDSSSTKLKDCVWEFSSGSDDDIKKLEKIFDEKEIAYFDISPSNPNRSSIAVKQSEFDCAKFLSVDECEKFFGKKSDIFLIDLFYLALEDNTLAKHMLLKTFEKDVPAQSRKTYDANFPEILLLFCAVEIEHNKNRYEFTFLDHNIAAAYGKSVVAFDTLRDELSNLAKVVGISITHKEKEIFSISKKDFQKLEKLYGVVNFTPEKIINIPRRWSLSSECIYDLDMLEMQKLCEEGFKTVKNNSAKVTDDSLDNVVKRISGGQSKEDEPTEDDFLNRILNRGSYDKGRENHREKSDEQSPVEWLDKSFFDTVLKKTGEEKEKEKEENNFLNKLLDESREESLDKLLKDII